MNRFRDSKSKRKISYAVNDIMRLFDEADFNELDVKQDITEILEKLLKEMVNPGL